MEVPLSAHFVCLLLFDFQNEFLNLVLVKCQYLIVIKVAEHLVIQTFMAVEVLTVTESVEPKTTLVLPMHSNHPRFIFLHRDVPLYHYLELLRFQHL